MKTIFLFLSISFTAHFYSQKTVEIIKYGQGPSEKKAINIALRSCIESTFGVFVSSSTEIENDELLYDQISTVANGYINDYKILSSKKNGTVYDVIVSANISPKKLVADLNKNGNNKFEVKGAVYVQNIQKERFYREQEYNVFQDFLKMYENQDFSQVEIKKIYKPEPAKRDIIKQTLSNGSDILKSHFGYKEWKGEWVGSSEYPDFKGYLINNPLWKQYQNDDQSPPRIKCGKKYIRRLNCPNTEKTICFYTKFNDGFFEKYPFARPGIEGKAMDYYSDINYYSIPVHLIIRENKNLLEFEKQLKILYEKVRIKETYEGTKSKGFIDSRFPQLFKYNPLKDIADDDFDEEMKRAYWGFRNHDTGRLISEFYEKHVFPCFDIRTSLCGNYNHYYYIASQMVYNANQNFYGSIKDEKINLSFAEFSTGQFGKRKQIKIPVAINIFLSEDQLYNLNELEFNHVNANQK